MHVLSYLFFMFAGYLSGSILYSYLIPRWFCHLDITKLSDDGNPGAANAVKCAGWRVGLVCVVLDILKGFFPVFIAMHHLDFTSWWFTPVISAPVFGHAFPPSGKEGRKSYRCFLWRAAGASSLVPLWCSLWLPSIFSFLSALSSIHIGSVPSRPIHCSLFTVFTPIGFRGRLETSIFLRLPFGVPYCRGQASAARGKREVSN